MLPSLSSSALYRFSQYLRHLSLMSVSSVNCITCSFCTSFTFGHACFVNRFMRANNVLGVVLPSALFHLCAHSINVVAVVLSQFSGLFVSAHGTLNYMYLSLNFYTLALLFDQVKCVRLDPQLPWLGHLLPRCAASSMN